MHILITGSSGLIGRSLREWAPTTLGCQVSTYDLRERPTCDVRALSALARAVVDCTGIVHLAAISRVVWGEADPAGCRATNVGGTLNVLRAAATAPRRPWVLLASSREVYGQPAQLPVSETLEPAPINVYGRSKVAAEELLARARADGMRTSIARLSNVYGRTDDHHDRVTPAFCRGAAQGAPLRIDGRAHTFDFTHVRDTVAGLGRIAELLEDGEAALPPLHLLTGRPTTLEQLATLANAAGGGRSELVDGPERDYDVAHFWGDPSRARALLGWTAQVSIEDGVRELVERFASPQVPNEGVVP